MWKLIRMVRDVANLSSATRLKIRWWLLENRWAWKLGWTFLVLIILAGLITPVWYSWEWIGKNAAPLMAVGAWITGLALVAFAFLTFMLSRRMVEFQYAPVLEVRSLYDYPKTGEVKRGPPTDYYGVEWEVCLINPGNAPVWVDRIEIGIKPTGRGQSWSTIDAFCQLLDKEGHPVDPRFAVRTQSHLTITVLVCDEETKKHLNWLYSGESEFIMRVILFQTRRLGKSSGWVDSRNSEKFLLPEKFGREPTSLQGML